MPNPNSNNVSILLGNGDGTFKAAVEYSEGAKPLSSGRLGILMAMASWTL